MTKQKGLAPILIILLIALIVGGYLLYQKQVKPVSQPQPSPNPAVSDETTTWKTYTNTEFGISFRYPPTYNFPTKQGNRGELITLISPLNPNRGQGDGLENGELKVEILIESTKENDTSEKCFQDHCQVPIFSDKFL